MGSTCQDAWHQVDLSIRSLGKGFRTVGWDAMLVCMEQMVRRTHCDCLGEWGSAHEALPPPPPPDPENPPSHTLEPTQTLRTHPAIPPNPPVLQLSWPLPRVGLLPGMPFSQPPGRLISKRSFPAHPSPPITQVPGSLQGCLSPGSTWRLHLTHCITGAIVICLPPLGRALRDGDSVAGSCSQLHLWAGT